LELGELRDRQPGGMAPDNICADPGSGRRHSGVAVVNAVHVILYNVHTRVCVLDRAALRNEDPRPARDLLVKHARGADEIGMEMDLLVKKDSSLDFVYITGAIGENYPGPNVFEMSANISLVDDLSVRGMRMNVDGERGLVFDFDKTNAQS